MTGLTYKDAGVDLDAANRSKKRIAELVRGTRTAGVVENEGGFGGLFRLPAGLVDPLLVSSADGVGTKLKVAVMADRHDTVGEDLVNHCVNDILVQGARPLFFLDYIGAGTLDPAVIADLVEGVARGCRNAGCALLGGETAEMPDMYADGEYDVAGTIVGAVAAGRLLDGSRVREGDALIGLASSGLHTNGYSLARRIVFNHMRLGVDDPFPDDSGSVADVLLRVHRSYLGAVEPLLKGDTVHALAHITGGGIPGNLDRVLPGKLRAAVDTGSWEPPNVFRVLQREGGVERGEMFRAFNMGVGMIMVVDAAERASVLEALRDAGEDAWEIGRIERAQDDGEAPVRLLGID